jgi:hypothetical protein
MRHADISFLEPLRSSQRHQEEWRAKYMPESNLIA